MAKKRITKQSYIKEICLIILGAVAMVASQLIATAPTQVATKGELQRLNGKLSLVASEAMIYNQHKLSAFVLIIGICLSITAIMPIAVKLIKEKRK